MQKNPRVFVSDTRNCGGRQHVIESMLSHQHKLREIISEPRTGPSQLQKKKKAHPYAIDTSPPITYELASKLSCAKQKKKQKFINEKEKKDANMLRRMEEYPLPHQRRLNPHDPSENPSLLFRSPLSPYLHPRSQHVQHSPRTNDAGTTSITPRKLYSATINNDGSRSSSRSRSRSPQRVTSKKTNSIHHDYNPYGNGNINLVASQLHGNSKRNHLDRHYERPASAIVKYTYGQPGRELKCVDNDEIEPGKEHANMRVLPTANGANDKRPFKEKYPDYMPCSYDLITSTPAYSEFAKHAEKFIDIEMKFQERSEKDPYQRLKIKLFNLIIEHRIFRENAIIKLLDKARSINSHLNHVKLNQVLDELKREFEITPYNYQPAPANPAASPTSKRPSSASARKSSSSPNKPSYPLHLPSHSPPQSSPESSYRSEHSTAYSVPSSHRSRSTSRSRSRSPSQSPRSRSHSSRSPSRSRSVSPANTLTRSQLRSQQQQQQQQPSQQQYDEDYELDMKELKINQDFEI